jgi:hypothetical protein
MLRTFVAKLEHLQGSEEELVAEDSPIMDFLPDQSL